LNDVKKCYQGNKFIYTFSPVYSLKKGSSTYYQFFKYQGINN